ncbi:MAG: RecQ family ATP-dependent DNA helicase [Cytophagales bacterium]|nr:MAG: RecQ family ATP-dependent DNA helicase [Cytophagales bacterium]TAF61238.1 MAG: RecQ family ATP-dependent DNA helicase [Cytophagales bacterium]
MKQAALDTLKKYWGYDDFRPLQLDIVCSVLRGNDTLALLPTGGGKSVCFQVPAMLLEGLCLVVSPLIALMKDQVEQLEKRQIAARSLFSGLSNREADLILDQVQRGQIKFLYVSPERLQAREFKERLKYIQVGLLAVDEAHCISQWGYDFRPPYKQIAELRPLLNDAPCIALTATATEAVREDIIAKLDFKSDYKVFTKSFARENLSYSVFDIVNKNEKLLQILRSVAGSAVVYVNSRRKTAEVAQFLKSQNVSADYYHAGLSTQERGQKQANWIHNKTRVIVATNAFGMGIDKPDVRVVVHLDLPNCLEAYYQEAGRGGRDEKKAYAVLLYNQNDLNSLSKQTNLAFPELSYIYKVYQSLADYFQIPMGAGAQSIYDFEIEEFIKKFNLDSQAFFALKKLEEQNIIQLNDAYHNPSRFIFLVSEADLYRFQVSHAALDPLIKTLLRLYGGGLYTQALPIQESKIAYQLKTDYPTIKKALQYLSQTDIGLYTPQNDSPQLVWLKPRFHAKELPIDVELLKTRKKMAQEKADSMIDYCQTQKICRTSFILNYFDEPNDLKCGVCDICLTEKRHENPNLEEELIQKIHLILTAHQPLNYNTLVQKIDLKDKNILVPLLRKMIDEGQIHHQDGFFRLH